MKNLSFEYNNADNSNLFYTSQNNKKGIGIPQLHKQDKRKKTELLECKID